ncbi:MAG: HD domain-containing protein [Patescibacteria group bacterium]|jgi:uncharacterized protein
MNQSLLLELKQSAEKTLAKNKRFHDFAHAMEVLNNVVAIIKNEGGDKDILYAAALFHDASNFQEKGMEGVDGAKIARKALIKIKVFPRKKIKGVSDLIISLDRQAMSLEETILSDADELASFSRLSVARGFMIYGSRGVTVKSAVEDFLRYIDKRYYSFKRKKSHTKTARKLAEVRYPEIKKFLQSLYLCTRSK